MRFGGSVRDRHGHPISNATVELRVNGKPSERDATVRTDESGEYKFHTFSCPCNFHLEIVASAPGYATYRMAMPGRKANRLDHLDLVLESEVPGPVPLPQISSSEE
jgi:protocatechuate 3,4-dioxygenase beta subunit